MSKHPLPITRERWPQPPARAPVREFAARAGGAGRNREVVAAINETAQAKISASYLSELLSGKKDPNIWTG